MDYVRFFTHTKISGPPTEQPEVHNSNSVIFDILPIFIYIKTIALQIIFNFALMKVWVSRQVAITYFM